MSLKDVIDTPSLAVESMISIQTQEAERGMTPRV
jgi:hypothetical protein